MIDIHTHILASVDDGSSSIEISRRMLEEEIKNGVDTILLTPHYILNTPTTLSKNALIKVFEDFKQQMSDLPVTLLLGTEIFFKHGVIKALKENELITLNNSKYVLVEFSPLTEYDEILNAVESIKALNYIPIIAHPERYEFLNFAYLQELKNLGALLQINTNPIINKGKSYKLIKKLLKHDLVDFIASDSHNCDSRKPNLLAAKNIINKKFKNAKINWDFTF